MAAPQVERAGSVVQGSIASKFWSLQPGAWSPRCNQTHCHQIPTPVMGVRASEQVGESWDQVTVAHQPRHKAAKGVSSRPYPGPYQEGTAMPNAVVMTRYGPPEVLKWAEVPLREPGEGQIRIKVKAAGISPTDLVLRAGYVKEVDRKSVV